MKVQFFYSRGGPGNASRQNEITKEMIEKALQRKTVEELSALAKTEGFDMTKEEAVN